MPFVKGQLLGMAAATRVARPPRPESVSVPATAARRTKPRRVKESRSVMTLISSSSSPMVRLREHPTIRAMRTVAQPRVAVHPRGATPAVSAGG
jgi:hypothetical protein